MNAAHDATWYSSESRSGSGPGVAFRVGGWGFRGEVLGFRV